MFKRGITAVLCLMLIGTGMISAAGSDVFDGLEGVVILSDDSETIDLGNDDSRIPESNEGLQLTLESAYAKSMGEYKCEITLEVSLINWELSAVALEDAISARLTYQDEYTFDAEADFNGETEIGMLVSLNGKLIFHVPYIVAFAGPDELAFEVDVLGDTLDIEPDFSDSLGSILKYHEIPFVYEDRKTDSLEMILGECQLRDTMHGNRDSKYKWIEQKFALINWGKEPAACDGSLDAMLTYMDKYGFEAEVELPKDQIGVLETLNGSLIFHVPVIVSEAEKDTLGLRICLEEDEWEEEFDLSGASRN